MAEQSHETAETDAVAMYDGRLLNQEELWEIYCDPGFVAAEESRFFAPVEQSHVLGYLREGGYVFRLVDWEYLFNA